MIKQTVILTCSHADPFHVSRTVERWNKFTVRSERRPTTFDWQQVEVTVFLLMEYTTWLARFLQDMNLSIRSIYFHLKVTKLGPVSWFFQHKNPLLHHTVEQCSCSRSIHGFIGRLHGRDYCSIAAQWHWSLWRCTCFCRPKLIRLILLTPEKLCWRRGEG